MGPALVEIDCGKCEACGRNSEEEDMVDIVQDFCVVRDFTRKARVVRLCGGFGVVVLLH